MFINNEEYIIHPNKDIAERILNLVKENDGYCPCRVVKDETTKCMCEEFKRTGECICGLYIKKKG